MPGGKAFNGNSKLEYSSVQKAISILLSFIPDNKPTGTLQLSTMLKLNKSTVSRLIQVLVHYGLVQQDSDTKKYQLGKSAALLGMAVEVSQTEQLAQMAQPYIDHLRDAVGESVCLEVLMSGRGKIIAEAIGPPPLSVSFPEGTLPMHVSAGVKVILAFSSGNIVDSMINVQMEKLTENTISDPIEYRAQLEEIRQQGIAYDHGEANTDVHTVSAPVFNHLKKPVGAIVVCVPANRVNKILNAKVISKLKQSANWVSERLFYKATDESLEDHQ